MTRIWAPLIGTLGTAIAAVLLILWVYMGWSGTRILSPGARRLALLLRLAAAALIAWTLLGMSQVEDTERSETEPCVVLLDRSRSMSLGVRRDSAVRAATERLAACGAAERDVTPLLYSFASGLDPGPLSVEGLTEADGEGTDLYSALAALRPALKGRRPASVTLITDGADLGSIGRGLRAGDDEQIRELLRPLEHPVDLVLTADERTLNDLRIAEVDVPGFAFVHRPLFLKVHLERRGDAPGKTELVFRVDGNERNRVPVKFDREGRGEAELEVTPEVLGTLDLDLEILQKNPDDLPGNDRRLLRVRVLRDRLRVLQLAGRPTWDVKFVRRLLKTDPNVDLVSFFIMRDAPERGGLMRMRELSLIEFPYRDLFTDDLQSFDLFIMHNFDLAVISRESPGRYYQNIVDRVSSGMGLIVTGGDQAFGNTSIMRGPVGAILPLTGGAGFEGGDFQLTPVRGALSHPILRLRAQPDANLEAWAALPPITGRHTGTGLQSGALSLLTTPGAQPVVAAAKYGDGRIVAVGTDGLWQWAMNPESAGDYRRLWSNILEWTVQASSNDRLRLQVEPINAAPTEPISILVRCLDGQDGPDADAPVALRLLADGADDSTAVELPAGQCDAMGLYQTELKSPGPGLWRLQAQRPDLAASTYHTWVEERFVVRDDSVEWDDPQPVDGLVAAITGITGGKRVPLGSAEPPSLAAPLPPSLVGQKREPLWDRMPVMGLIVLLLGAEWILRRRGGAA